ncbi:MAG: triose-phosphate isomerase [Thermoanaerobaculia bacterium]|nr:triose-phosphate isomerase [Thermoanaerobaculia bacterium]
MSERIPLVGGNWKMHLVSSSAVDYCDALLANDDDPRAEVVLFPSFPMLPLVAAKLEGSWAACGAQDLHPEDEGAHTGDVSGLQLRDAGSTWVLCGHSERRHDHGEGDDVVRRKVEAATRHGLMPMICVGETGDERKAGRTLEVLERQLTAALAAEPTGFALAYEPVWAIGTGETATPETAQEAHEFLRRCLADRLGDDVAGVRRIVYGGSVKPDNAASLAAQPDIDGFLVGGASLDPEKFWDIIRCWGS